MIFILIHLFIIGATFNYVFGSNNGQNWSGKFHEHDWDYDDKGDYGPSNWHKKYPECGSRKRQSPIEIWPNHLETPPCDSTKGKHWMEFVNYETPLNDLHVLNNGHSIMVKLPAKSGLQLSASFLGSRYDLNSLHFHWGPTPNTGSEHKIAQTYYPFEMHLVHFKVGVKEPSKEIGGIAVIGVFFRYGSKEKFNPELHKIANKLHEIEHADQNSTIDSLSLINLLPQNRDKLLRYNGSLTTPPCNEVVDWMIFTDPGFISPQDLKLFSNLLPNMTKGFGNNRPRQPFSGRKITFYTNLDNVEPQADKPFESELEKYPNIPLESKAKNRANFANALYTLLSVAVFSVDGRVMEQLSNKLTFDVFHLSCNKKTRFMTYPFIKEY